MEGKGRELLKFIDVEYNEDLKPLEIVLAGVKQPGDFFVNGALECQRRR